MGRIYSREVSMVAEEVYRIEIPIQTVDHTEPALGQAQQRVSRFEQSMRRSEQQLQRINRTRWQMILYALDRATPVLSSISSKAKSLVSGSYRITLRVLDLATTPIRALFNMMTSPLGMLGAAGGFGALTIWPLQLAGNMEQAKIGFETMLGSAQKATNFINQLKKLAAETPFEFPDLQASAKRLLAFGFAAEKIVPMLKIIGDAASGLGLGAEGMSRITLAIGQMRAKSKISADEMLQLTEAGIPGWQFLADAMHKSTAEVMKLSEKGLIPADKGIQMILDGMAKKFPNMMQKQSRSLLGLLSTIKDVFNLNIVTSWGEGLRQAIQPRMVKIVDYFTKNEATTKAWEKALESAGRTVGNYVLNKVEEVQKAMSDLANDNKFAKGDLWTKASMAWDKIIEEPFNKWWGSGGQKFVADAAEKLGDGIGSLLGGFLSSALGIAAQDANSQKNPFVQAGTTAGKAFYDGFIVAFDTKKVAGKAAEAFTNLQPSPSKSTGGNILGTLFDLWLLSKVTGIGGKMISGVKGVGGAWKWLRGLRGGTAANVAPIAEAAATAANAAPVAATAETIDILGANGQVLRKVAKAAPEIIPAAVPEVAATTSKASKVMESLSFLKGGAAEGAMRGFGKVAIPLALAYDTYRIGTAAPGVERAKAIGGAAGGWGGAAAGMAAGAALGSVVPVIGTAAGAIIGGILGSLGGGSLGEWIGGKVAGKPAAVPVPTTAGKPPVVVQVQATSSPKYSITTAASPAEVLKIIRDNQNTIADELSDEIGANLALVFGNMPLGLGPLPAPAKP